MTDHQGFAIRWNSGEAFPGIWGWKLVQYGGGANHPDSAMIQGIINQINDCGCLASLRKSQGWYIQWTGVCGTV